MTKKLVSYRLDEHTQELIKELSEKLNCSETDVCRKALLLQKAVADNQANGGCVVIGGREVIFL